MRNLPIDLLKHFFALAVVFMHMKSDSRYTPELNSFITNISNYLDGAVMGFFMIAGFFIKPLKTQNVEDLKAKIKKSIRRLGGSYLILSIFYLIILVAINKGEWRDLIVNIIKLNGSSMQLYFLPYLLIISSIYLLMLFASGKRYWWMAILVSHICFFVSLVLPTDSSTGDNIRLTPLYLACLSVGFMLGRLYERPSLYRFTAAGMYVVFICLLVGTFDHRFYDVAVVLSLITLASLVSRQSWCPSHALPGSGCTFLFHAPILNYGLSTILVLVGVNELPNLLISFLSTYICCLIITYLIIKRFNKLKILFLE